MNVPSNIAALEVPGTESAFAPRLDSLAVFDAACREALAAGHLADNASLVLEILAAELGLVMAKAALRLRQIQARKDRISSSRAHAGFDPVRLYLRASAFAHEGGNLHPEDRGLLDRLAAALGLGWRECLELDRKAWLRQVA